MNKIAVVYWSGTGNTETMAGEISKGIRSANAEADLFTALEFSADKVAGYDKFAFGCPAMGAEELEESEFDPMFSSVQGALAGKEILLFGSYGWGDREWMREWQARCTAAGALVFGGKGLTIYETPDSAGLELCKEFGKAFAAL